jgi:hypothetical protein
VPLDFLGKIWPPYQRTNLSFPHKSIVDNNMVILSNKIFGKFFANKVGGYYITPTIAPTKTILSNKKNPHKIN